MKKLILSFFLIAIINATKAQTFTDSFESYTAGSYLAQSNGKWSTWKAKPGTAEDVKVTNAKAHSGKNSIYFTSSLTTGGPTDVILPLGGVYNSGNFVMDMWMFVETGKVGYFNFQETATPGTSWTMDMNLNSDGTFKILNTTDGTLLTGNYSQNQWNEIQLKVNLNTGSWELLINGTSKGKFTNSINAIASLDLFAMANSSFYIDDISYTFTPYTKPNLNCAAVSIGSIPTLSGQSGIPTAKLRNMGLSDITACDVTIDYNGKKLTKNLSGITIASGAVYTCTFGSPLTLIAGSNTATLTVSNVNGNSKDDDGSDDILNVIINPLVPAADKIVIAEEATGTWCGWCPRGAVFLEKMSSKYGNLFQGIAVHNNDPMANKFYDSSLGVFLAGKGYPTVVVDRLTGIDPSGIETDFLSEIMIAPKGVIQNGAKFNKSTGELTVSLTTTFKEDVTGDYRIACVLVEDGVTGTDTKYAQANYYAGGAKGVMGGFELKANPVPANEMVYDHVARFIAPALTGLQNSFPASATAGVKYTQNFTFNISGFKSDNFHIVGMLINPAGKTDNGSSSTIAEAIANGYIQGIEKPLKTNTFSLYPTPASNNLYLKGIGGNIQYNITDLTGKVVLSGETTTNQISLEHLTTGIYLLQITNEGEVYTSKFVVE